MSNTARALIAVVQAGNEGAGASGSSGGPGSNFDPTAWIALILSIIGILVTVVLRYLDGPRVRVRVRPVLFNVGPGHTVTYHGGQWPIPTASEGGSLKKPDPGEVIELAEILIENTGRNPATVYEVGFRWLGKKRKGQWWRRRVHHSSVPTPIRPPNQEGPFYADGDQFRLEPSDVVSVLANYWDLVRSQRPNPKGRIELRAAVRVAGRHRLKLSPRKSRWRIPDDAVTSVGKSKKIPLRAVITKSIGLSLLYSKSKSLGDIYFLSRSLEAALEGKWSDDWKSNHERLRHFQKDSNVHFVVYDQDLIATSTLMFSLQRAVDDYKDVIDWTDIAQPGVHKMFSAESRAEEAAKLTAVEAGTPVSTSDGLAEPVDES
ncbi:hypothetical protein [uncultured Leifsonia sp.]|uniref:hypothetical protein n=1 Tax=uncultured Leifsonia sp. TaxID=340359 RepID=UPI0025D8343D|nr:hypothetical protein [uncultured Leifsonia sp.]